MSVRGVRFNGSGHCAFGAAVVKDGHDALEAPLLALGDVLLRSAGRGHVLVDSFEDVVGRNAPRNGLQRETLSLVHKAGQADNQSAFIPEVFMVRRFRSLVTLLGVPQPFHTLIS